MTPEMHQFIQLLESELGYTQKAGTSTKFGDWYAKSVDSTDNYGPAPWCDMYMSWAAHKLGYDAWIGQFAWTVSHARWFKEQHAWGTKPKAGALVFYNWHGSKNINSVEHVGVVTRVEGNLIHTIEGNIDNGVAKRKVRDTSLVVGYGYPEKIKARLEATAHTKGDLSPKTFVGTQSPVNGLTTYIPLARQDSALAQAVNSSSGVHPALEASTQSLPGRVDAAAFGEVPHSMDSPAMVGTAVVAALTVLAVAKTRQMRLNLAAAGPLSDTMPARGRRRRGSKHLRAVRAVPTTTALSVAADPAVLDPAALTPAEQDLLDTVEIRATADTAAHEAVTETLPAITAQQTGPAEDAADSSLATTTDIFLAITADLADDDLAAEDDDEKTRNPVRLTPLDLHTPTLAISAPKAPAGQPTRGETTATFNAFGAASGRGTSFRRLGAEELSHSLEERHEGRAEERENAAYRGRRRKRAEERFPAAQAGAQSRGRHRTARAGSGEQGRSGEEFHQDAPLRGRRHRDHTLV